MNSNETQSVRLLITLAQASVMSQVSAGFFSRSVHNSHLCLHYTVVSEKNGTFICELLMKRYIYLRNTERQLKITIYDRNKSFSRISSSLQWCLFETSRIIIIEVKRYCTSIY